jgi:hypothetical protein
MEKIVVTHVTCTRIDLFDNNGMFASRHLGKHWGGMLVIAPELGRVREVGSSHVLQEFALGNLMVCEREVGGSHLVQNLEFRILIVGNTYRKVGA